MNTEILTRMSLDGLRKLEAAVKAELERRLDYSLRPGRTAWFTTTKPRKGIGSAEVHCIVERINRTTVTVKELSDSPHYPGMSWKVSPGMLRIEPVERKTPTAPMRPASSRPMTTAAATW